MHSSLVGTHTHTHTLVWLTGGDLSYKMSRSYMAAVDSVGVSIVVGVVCQISVIN